MRAVVQRCNGARVVVDGEVLGGFPDAGLAVLVGVRRGDSATQAAALARKLWNLRLFPAPSGSTGPKELSAADLSLPMLVISQFTLYGRTDKGRRPTWEDAAPGPEAEPLVRTVVDELRQLGAEVSTGRFGAHMLVTLTNDGPVTLILEV